MRDLTVFSVMKYAIRDEVGGAWLEKDCLSYSHNIAKRDLFDSEERAKDEVHMKSEKIHALPDNAPGILVD